MKAKYVLSKEKFDEYLASGDDVTCPECGEIDADVIDTQLVATGVTVFWECLSCNAQWFEDCRPVSVTVIQVSRGACG